MVAKVVGGSGWRCRRTACGRQLVVGGDAGGELIVGGDAGGELIGEAAGEWHQDRRQQGRVDTGELMDGMDGCEWQPVVAVVEADGFSENQRRDGLRKKNARGRCCDDRESDQGQ
ncbi:hypothetical protein ACLOJK_006483 [Asimina triloba]